MSLSKPMNVNLTLRYEENQMEIKHKITGEVLLATGGDTLRDANLEYFDLQYADLKGVDLERANLRGADLRGADLQGANLRCANLQGTNLEWADLRYAKLPFANLEGANLRGADLQWVNLRYANLQMVNLREANLRGVNLEGANLAEATLPTKFIRIDGMKWDVTISYGYIRIGCQYHYVDVWNEFTDDEIAEMARGALEFWKENKQMIITVANFTK